MKKISVLLSSSLLLLACGGAPSADKLAKDPELLAKVMMECAELQLKGENTDIAKCNNAKKAQQQLMNDVKKELNELLGN
ncbi:EexN family lipoprotein [Alkalimonas mucilaginosa]|uniref:EexN family lipoprotein n=1 Tax=Alkalimonas mucilaginosa TaxID=3057676 RepID=A0ABU7JEZ2_9GAMM|nr:EexN family lipoprotein [Alkalimonas sp. MEB004]MEE2024253.1 EexN family lipoprotein [Alkalimonas sp. MEB004]